MPATLFKFGAERRKGFFGVRSRAWFAGAMAAACLATTSTIVGAKVTTMRVPEGGIQPQVAVEADGTVHMIYYTGAQAAGDVFYVRSRDGGRRFSEPLRVNSQPHCAIAVGNIRGAHLALGRNGRAHVAWMGGQDAQPTAPGKHTPMLYARLNDDGDAFEPQRNVIQKYVGLDGGGSVAADAEGNVYVAWHAFDDGARNEANRRVWIARSTDDGRTFAPETAATNEPTGACGCCGMRAFAAPDGDLFVLYRAATADVNRDMILLASRDRGGSFTARKLDEWKINQCVMSSAALVDGPRGPLAGWETEGQVYFAPIGSAASGASERIAAPGAAERRKHPAVAANAAGETMLAWAEGVGWNQGGAVAWQVYDANGRPISGAEGRADGVPKWSLVAVFARADGGFTVVY